MLQVTFLQSSNSIKTFDVISDQQIIKLQEEYKEAPEIDLGKDTM
jgi:hypothetical protein